MTHGISNAILRQIGNVMSGTLQAPFDQWNLDSVNRISNRNAHFFLFDSIIHKEIVPSVKILNQVLEICSWNAKKNINSRETRHWRQIDAHSYQRFMSHCPIGFKTFDLQRHACSSLVPLFHVPHVAGLWVISNGYTVPNHTLMKPWTRKVK